MVVREVSLLSPQAKPEKPLGFFNVSLCIRSFVPRFNVAKLQRKEGPLVFVVRCCSDYTQVSSHIIYYIYKEQTHETMGTYPLTSRAPLPSYIHHRGLLTHRELPS